VGDLILGNYEEKGIWFEGVLTSFALDGQDMFFSVEYFDGDVEENIAGSCVILASKGEE
jgi:hypothetical protein